jgi:hypothetical protein
MTRESQERADLAPESRAADKGASRDGMFCTRPAGVQHGSQPDIVSSHR